MRNQATIIKCHIDYKQQELGYWKCTNTRNILENKYIYMFKEVLKQGEGSKNMTNQQEIRQDWRKRSPRNKKYDN